MKIQNFITDEVGVINEKEIALFNKTLKTLYERDGEDVRFIFISDDICWDSEEDFLLTNNIGDPQRHNGMVFILNIKDNQVRVFAWKGLYLKYTDIFKHQYVENIIKPHLTNRKYKQIIETWIYDHNGSSILDNFQEIDRTKWNLLAILFPFIFIPFLAYTLFDILKQIGYTVSLFAVGLISYLAYVFYREDGFWFLWNQRKNWPWSVFIMMLLILFIFTLFSFYWWILSSMLAFACLYLWKKYKRGHWLLLWAIFLLYTTIVFFPSTCDQNRCVTHIWWFTFQHTASQKR